MIYDKMSNIAKYKVPQGAIDAVTTLLANPDIAEGRHDFADGVFANVGSHNTKNAEDCRAESHIEYADIQCVMIGEERFGIAFEGELDGEYIPAKDIIYYFTKDKYVDASAGEFVMFFPQDIHKPKIGDGGFVKKAIVKVPMSSLK